MVEGPFQTGDEVILKIAEKFCTLRTGRITWPTDWPLQGTEPHLTFGLTFDMVAGGMFAWVA